MGDGYGDIYLWQGNKDRGGILYPTGVAEVQNYL